MDSKVKNYLGLIKRCHGMAKEKGWWEKDRSFPEVRMLILSELFEAFEEIRKGTPMIYQIKGSSTLTPFDKGFDKSTKPEGLAIEIADVIIRVCDFLGSFDESVLNGISGKFLTENLFEASSDIEQMFPRKIRNAKTEAEKMDAIVLLMYALDNDIASVESNNVADQLKAACAFSLMITLSYLYKDKFDIAGAVEMKLAYNKTRPHRHGGKLL